jgi:serine/threonine protein kinase
MQQRAIAGRYEITSPIARGGIGEVWAACDKRLDRPVAVKLLRPDALPTSIDREALARRFVRESRLTARVAHGGVPAVFDAGNDQGSLYLVMQLVPGIDLADFIAERAPLSVGTAAAVAAQIVSVLAAAHAVPAVHRDLKPSNVMIRPDGTVVVLDFGVAALLEADVTKLTDTGEMLGSPAYMSPEQVLGAVLSPRSDLYALGCILHEMLTGERLFWGERSWAVVRQHMEDEPRPLRSLRSDVPESLERLVLDLLAKQPEDRPPDAFTVYDRLHEHLPSPGLG